MDIIYYLIGLLPFLMGLHRPYISVGFSLKLFIVVVALVVLFLIIAVIQHGKIKISLPVFFFPALALVLASLISVTQAIEPGRSLVLIVAFIISFVLGLLLYTFAKRSSAEHVITVISWSGILLGSISIIGYILEIAGIIPEAGFIIQVQNEIATTRMQGIHDDPNIFAVNMSLYLMVSLSVILFVRLEKRLYRLTLLCFVLTAFCVLASISRGGILGIVCGALILLFLNARHVFNKLLRHIAILVILLAVLSGLFFLVVPSDIRDYFFNRVTNYSTEKQIKSDASRFFIWESKWKMFLVSPLAGTGLGNSSLMGDRYTHNTHLEILVETGIVGFLAYLWLLVAIFFSAWKIRKRATGNQKVLLVGLMIASFTLLIQATFVSVEFEPVLWGTWGMLTGTTDRIKRGLV